MKIGLLPTTFLICVGLLLAVTPSQVAAPQTQSGADLMGVGADQCLMCHNRPDITAILETPHAVKADPRTPFAGNECETCHGFNPEHFITPTDGGERALVEFLFGAESSTPISEQNAVCLDCHEGGARMNWLASQHESADIACVSCHDIHQVQDKVLVKTSQPEVCYECHAEQRAQSRRRSRHPIREGKVVCSDCHNPHGSIGTTLLKQATINDTCYTCHAEKRGPFLWEHAPVTDDCTNCHTPHGSSQPRLLKVRTPWLCQQCHQEAFHPSTVYSGTGIPPMGAADRLLASGCLNCHTKVHGSNHPSGVRLTR